MKNKVLYINYREKKERNYAISYASRILSEVHFRDMMVGMMVCVFLCIPVSSDRLPQGIPENQVWTTTSLIEGVGFTTESTSLNWYTSDAGLTELPKPDPDEDVTTVWRGGAKGSPSFLYTPSSEEYDVLSGSTSYMVYKDTVTSNGGQISEVKSFSMDTHKKTEGAHNVETEKVLTYTSQNGSHLLGSESYLLDVMGMWSPRSSELVCVFSSFGQKIIPAFCNKVTASSKLRSVTTAQIESIGAVTAVGASPAVLDYEISVTPDSTSASGFADATVSTMFTVNVMEGRTDEWQGGDPFHDGRWELWSNAWRWYPHNPGNEITAILLRRFTGYDSIEVEYRGVGYGDFGPAIVGQAVLLDSQNEPLPPEAQFSVDGGDGTGSYIVTYLGAVYRIDASDVGIGIGLTPYDFSMTLLHPGLPNYDELTSTMMTKDMTMVTGGISSFMKAFKYHSGVDCEGC